MAPPSAPSGRINSVEQDVLELIDVARIHQDLTSLVAIPSVGGSDAEHDVQAWCADRLRGIGLDVDHWNIDVSTLAKEPDFPGMEVERDEAWGCVGVSGGEGDPALILNGHVDVVPPGDLDRWPNRDPYTLRNDGTVWAGRGTCDMKGGVVAFIAAAAAVRASGVTLARPFALHTVIGEEDGGLGSYATLRRGHTGSACLIAEPTNRQIVVANAGSLTFRIEIAGRATHGSTRRAGISAIEKFELLHAALRDLETERNRARHPLFGDLDLPWPLSVGIIRAGDWASTVPDLCIAEGRYGVMPGESLDEAIAAFDAAIGAVVAEDPWFSENPPTLSWPGGRFTPAELSLDDPLIGKMQDAVTDVGAPFAPAVGLSCGSDLRQYAAAGIPTLQYGPGDIEFAHADGEHVEPSAIAECARAYALMILRSCT
ncbi:MAG: ArgE/DapE family deacylase [Propionibacteriales bacterium]|nr:ArgE/DapE family deacylase [Propionibacteriales bacterium]